MSSTEHLLNAVLIGLVVLQIRGRRLTPRLLLLPLAVVAVVASQYLRAVPTAGNDLVVVAAGAALGAVLGTGCGLATAVYPGRDGSVWAKAGPAAAALWVAGVGARLAFALYVTHGGGQALGRFSAAHAITASTAWVDGLVLMALAEVVCRSGVLAARYRRSGRGAGQPAPAMMDAGGRTL
jgi:hypothetical protein